MRPCVAENSFCAKSEVSGKAAARASGVSEGVEMSYSKMAAQVAMGKAWSARSCSARVTLSARRRSTKGGATEGEQQPI